LNRIDRGERANAYGHHWDHCLAER